MYKRLNVKCTLVQVLWFVQTVGPVGGVELWLYCAGTEALYRPYGPYGE